MNRKKIGLAVLALALCIGVASATLLQYFGTIQTDITVVQSILLDGKDDGQMPITESLIDVFAGFRYGVTHYLENYANVPAQLFFDADTSAAGGITPRYVFLAYLMVTGDPGTEARVVIPMPDGTTLGDIETISWLVNTVYGYPPHVDITLETGNPDADMLTAEIAYNNAMDEEITAGFTYDTWLKTFELSSGDGYGQIDDNTMLWVTKMGAGDDNAPSSTLAHWKEGIVDNNPDTLTPDPDLTGVITASTPVLKLEIEVDNWIMDTEAYVGKIEFNGALCTELPVKEVGEQFTLNPNEPLYFCVEYDIPIDLVGTYTITTYVPA